VGILSINPKRLPHNNHILGRGLAVELKNPFRKLNTIEKKT